MAIKGTAIVTGAGTGIGRSVATALLKDGWNTVFCGRRKALLEEAIAGAGEAEARALAVACDITQPNQVEALFEEVVATFGRVDLLFNNAGMGYKSTPIDEIPVEVWNDVVAVNLTGSFLCARAAFAAMRRQTGTEARFRALHCHETCHQRPHQNIGARWSALRHRLRADRYR